jgi:Tfp pilus assembly protein PilX
MRMQRSRERGATLFVVVLAITLLTGVGLYSLHSSALVARASGNLREARQATYLAELATLAMLSDAAQSDPSVVVKDAKNPDSKYPCKNNLGTPTSGRRLPSCGKKQTFAPATGATLVAADTFGPYSDIAGNTNVEITDIADGPPAVGFSSEMMFYYAKFTTTAMLERSGAGNACIANMKPISGQHVTRAHVVLGPMLPQP